MIDPRSAAEIGLDVTAVCMDNWFGVSSSWFARVLLLLWRTRSNRDVLMLFFQVGK